MKEDRLLAVSKLDMDEVRSFLQTRKSAVISPNLQTYILQLDTVARILHTNRLSVKAAILQIRREWPELTVAQARGIYYDGLEFFYHDDQASASMWDKVYADFFDDLSRLSIASGKEATALRAAELAHKLRTTVREAQEYQWRAPVYLININVKPEDLGYESQKLADIARRAEDRKFADMIGSLETTEAEKARLLADAGIKTVDFEKVDEDES